MAKPKIFTIKESVEDLKALLKKQKPFLANRVKLLLECKKHEDSGISKRELALKVGVDPNSVTTWRNLYIEGGIEALLSHSKVGFKPSILGKEGHEAVEKKLKNPRNQIQGYKELMLWIKKELDKPIKYKTLYAYVRRHFGTKIKVARKSHLKKDEKAGELLKKNSVQYAKALLKKKPKTSKK